jgi:hypothetical protein
VLLHQITLETPLEAALGSVANQCIPFGRGVGIARCCFDGEPGLAEDADDLVGGADVDEPALERVGPGSWTNELIASHRRT